MKYLRILKWVILTFVVIFFLSFLHYTLPARDIVRIVGTDVKRMDISSSSWFWASADAGTVSDTVTRDIRFINAVWPDGSSQVYRNEDTAWSWPPYFKFNSGDMNAEAQALAKEEGEVWVAVRHYGWRSNFASIFPNATSFKRVSGPDASLIPWFNIVFLIVLAALLFWLYRRWRRLKARFGAKAQDKN